MILKTALPGIVISLTMFAACGEQARPPVENITSVDISHGETLALACTGCHATGNTHLIDLSGRTPDELTALLAAYRTDADGTTVMHRIARGYSEADLAAIVQHLAEAPLAEGDHLP